MFTLHCLGFLSIKKFIIGWLCILSVWETKKPWVTEIRNVVLEHCIFIRPSATAVLKAKIFIQAIYSQLLFYHLMCKISKLWMHLLLCWVIFQWIHKAQEMSHARVSFTLGCCFLTGARERPLRRNPTVSIVVLCWTHGWVALHFVIPTSVRRILAGGSGRYLYGISHEPTWSPKKRKKKKGK